MEVISKEQPRNKTDIAWLILFEAVFDKMVARSFMKNRSYVLLDWQ